MKLHIGAGDKFLPGYKHMDVISRPHIDYVGDAGDLSFLSDDSVEEIYACHILEHFGRHEVAGVLAEWYKKLARGGTLRISVPDFEAIMAEYAQGANLERLIGLLYGGQNYKYNFHYQAYDFPRLKGLLEDAGFINISTYDWRDFLPAGYDDYSRAYMPHMDFENGRLMSLNVMAVKG
jgi:predicted SAM-dependent methyltransferase